MPRSPVNNETDGLARPQYHSKLLYQHWSLFIPDSRFARLRKTLFTLIESDPVPSVRLQAATALEAMLQASSAYLAIADDKSVLPFLSPEP